MAENTGLLGFLQSPEGQGLLSAAFGGLAGAQRGTPWNNVGRAGMAGMMGYGNALDRQTQLAQLAKQNEVRDLQTEQMRRQLATQQRQETWRQQLPAITSPQLTGTTEQERILAEQNAPFGDEGARSLAQIGNLPGMNYGVDQGKLNQHLMSPDSPFSDKLLEQQLFPKASDYKVVGNSLVKIDPTKGTAAPVFSEPKAEEKEPDAVRQYRFAQGQGYKGDFTSWLLANKRAGASSVTVPVNMGQKGFDNTLKLRGDFRSEPVYKAHQEMSSAYGQIKQSLKQASPAGDLAGATKIMKLLDPGSVVRESELGMAMSASGLMDRAQNYAQMVMSGQKLTPSQRADFQKLADALYSESVTQYNAKRSEYQGIAERNSLSVQDVLGDESRVPVKPAEPAGNDLFNQADMILRGGR